MKSVARYRARTGPTLVWRSWGEDTVLFDVASGDTHQLDAITRAGFRCLERADLTAVDLAFALAQALDLPNDATLSLYAERLLARLDELGLVDEVSP